MGKDKTGVSSNLSSIVAHISNINETVVTLTQFVLDVLTVDPIDDPIWNCTSPCDISINTINNTNVVTGVHVENQEYQEYHNQRD